MQDIDYQKIGQRMKQARIAANYTQEQLANDLSCTPAYISNIENSRTKLNLRVLIYYARLCGVPMEYFLDPNLTEPTLSLQTRDRISPALSPEEESLNRELFEIVSSLSIHEKQKLVSILKIWKS